MPRRVWEDPPFTLLSQRKVYQGPAQWATLLLCLLLAPCRSPLRCTPFLLALSSASLTLSSAPSSVKGMNKIVPSGRIALVIAAPLVALACVPKRGIATGRGNGVVRSYAKRG